MKLTKEEKELLKECKEHIHFTRNINIHAYQNILMKQLINIIEKFEPAEIKKRGEENEKE